jgi:hypothetical protein
VINTQENKPLGVINYIDNFDFAEEVRKLVKVGTSIPNNKTQIVQIYQKMGLLK